MSNFQLAILLAFQLTVILAACQMLGWIGRRFLGQTQVVMEMVAGVLLGPSLFGWAAPSLQASLFPRTLDLLTPGGEMLTVPHPAMAVLFALGQVGLVLYMFLVGLEVDFGLLRGRTRAAAIISTTGIAVPMAFGGLLGLALEGRGDLFDGRVEPWTAFLYLGASMSITAFPMLARILRERRLGGTALGTLTLAAGSLDDAAAWCLLAVVLASLDAEPARVLLTVGGGLTYALLLLLFLRPFLARWLERGFAAAGGRLTEGIYTGILLLLMLGTAITDGIGIYAVFGAFLAGAAMPRGPVARAIEERTEPLTTSLLLPIFFVYSGLNTRIALVDSWELAGIAIAVIAVAILGKGLACTLATRWLGESWRDAATLGTLMNARGLMELIILNIGLERGIITPTLFAIMVLMAVVTTVIASPLYRWIRGEASALQGPSPG